MKRLFPTMPLLQLFLFSLHTWAIAVLAVLSFLGLFLLSMGAFPTAGDIPYLLLGILAVALYAVPALLFVLLASWGLSYFRIPAGLRYGLWGLAFVVGVEGEVIVLLREPKAIVLIGGLLLLPLVAVLLARLPAFLKIYSS